MQDSDEADRPQRRSAMVASKLSSPPWDTQIASRPFALPSNQFAAIISVYAPKLMADPTIKEAFYSNLRSFLWKVNSGDAMEFQPNMGWG